MVTAAAKVLQWPSVNRLPGIERAERLEKFLSPISALSSAVKELPFALTSPDPMSPEKKTRKPRRRRKPPVSLSDEQLLALLGKAKEHRQRDYVMILITYWHGLRASETVNLRENDFNLDDGTVQIVRGKGSEGGSHTLQEFPDNPLLNEAVVVAEWLANRERFGVKGGAKADGRQRSVNARLHSAKMQQSTQIVAFSPESEAIDGSRQEQVVVPGAGTGLYSEPGPAAASDLSGMRPACPLPEKPAGGSEPQAYPPEAASGLPIERVPPQNVESDQNPRLFPIGRIQFWRIVHGYALAAGIPRRKCKTHMLKHTIAKHLVRAGHPLNEIQEWMGWSTIETMNWYTRADEEELGNRIGATIRSKDGLRQVQQGKLFP